MCDRRWLWTWGSWNLSLGVFRGFGLGVLVFSDEASVTLACFAFHAEKELDDGTCFDCTAKGVPWMHTPCPDCGSECGHAYCKPCEGAA